MKRLLIPILILLLGSGLKAEDYLPYFKGVQDSLSLRIQERTGVKGRIVISKIMKRDGLLDLYFTKDLIGIPWRPNDAQWFRKEVERLFPDTLKRDFRLGAIYAKSLKIEEVETPAVNYTGKPVKDRWAAKDPGRVRFIEHKGARKFPKGLDGRFIALWQSHGRYWDEAEKRWAWQRPTLFGTVEDMFTQSYVIPFLMPMLENAGAFVMSPREVDTGSYEVVADNDPAFREERTGLLRRKGSYKESGKWSDAGTGFADAKASYCGEDNPFTLGTARKAEVSRKGGSSISWGAEFPGRGRRSVYVSYKSVPGSTTCARYTVHHLGGKSVFYVDQSRGGSTWIRLGEFEFGADGSVTLDNGIPEGRKVPSGSVVTADAVRFGGGMGKVARCGAVSGMPSYVEGASYNMLWGGFGKEINHGWDRDYTSDFAGRGLWVQELKKRRIPFDLSLAFHTDAGITPSDSTVGTLAIYTLKAEGSRKTTEGIDRMNGRLLADFVQTQVVSDIRSNFDSDFSRREIWDRSYSESRTTDIPGMILELLSHQNFADMRLGLEPAFRFTVSRAVYKGVLKFLSSLYGCEYAVQPLPVRAFSAGVKGGKAVLSWKPTSDPGEPTAFPKGYTVYTRIDDGGFDEGREVKGTGIELPIRKGHIYSFRVCAWNDGGLSFPSETLCVYEPEVESTARVLIVNGFTEVRGPKVIDTPGYAGMLFERDYGVPYIEDIHYIGAMYNFDREDPYVSDLEPGFGASYSDYVPSKVAGNTFDYPYLHGRVLKEMGVAFTSGSLDAFLSGDPEPGSRVLDLIFGKQHKPLDGRTVEALQNWTSKGGSVLVSGSEVASAQKTDTTGMVKSIFGFRFTTSSATRDGAVGDYRIRTAVNPDGLFAESPQGLRSGAPAAKVTLKYRNENIGAAVFYNSGSYRTAAYGFPLEALSSGDDFRKELTNAMKFILE